MNDDRNRRQANWGSMIGWLIFLMAIAGPAIVNGINQFIGGSFTLSSNLLPLIIFGLLALSIVVPIVRSIGGAARSSGETRLPTSTNPTARTPTTTRTPTAPQPPFGDTTSRTPTAPQPPFGGTTSRTPTAPQPPFGNTNTTSTTRSINTGTRRGSSQMPSPPRFEPIINPTILAFGVVGVLVLLGTAFVVLGLLTP